MIYWFTGQPSSGKTTLAKLLVEQFQKQNECVQHIDGDGLRKLTQNFDYTESGRRSNIKKAQEIARQQEAEGCVVVVSVVAPYLDLREVFKEAGSVLEFYTHTSQKREKDKYHASDYQQPIHNFIDINTDFSVEDCFRKIMEAVKKQRQYSMFVGRYQPLHDGHKWLFEQRLKKGKNILICVRDMLVDESNPFSAREVKENIETHFSTQVVEGKVKVIIIPDIESVNYGRGVGYEILEHVPPEEIGDISATAIRKLSE